MKSPPMIGMHFVVCHVFLDSFVHLFDVVISTLRWDQEKERNVKVLANTPSTKATKEVTG